MGNAFLNIVLKEDYSEELLLKERATGIKGEGRVDICEKIFSGVRTASVRPQPDTVKGANA